MFGYSPEEDLHTLCWLHDQIIDASGGIKGFHDERLVRSALARPMQSAFGKDMYTDFFMKAAALLDSIANNHGFLDGINEPLWQQLCFIWPYITLKLILLTKNMSKWCCM